MISNKIDQITNIKSEFKATIADVKFTDRNLFNAVYNVINAMLEKFHSIKYIPVFVYELQKAIDNAVTKEQEDMYDRIQRNLFKTESNNIPATSYKSIEMSLIKAIKHTKDLEDVIFMPCGSNNPFESLNRMLHNGTFNPDILSDKQIEMIKKDKIFTVEEVENCLNNTTTVNNKVRTIMFYYDLINEQIRAEYNLYNKDK